MCCVTSKVVRNGVYSEMKKYNKKTHIFCFIYFFQLYNKFSMIFHNKSLSYKTKVGIPNCVYKLLRDYYMNVLSQLNLKC